MSKKIEKLVRMANQIADFYGPYQDAEAVSGIFEHLRSFWTKSMREELIAFAKAGGTGLRPRVALALERFSAAASPVETPAGPKLARAAGDAR